MSVRNVLDFETALQSSPELAALARGNRHLPGVSVSRSPPPTHRRRRWRKSPGGAGCAAPRPRVNGSRAFWKKLVLVLNTFPAVPRPLNQKQLSSPAARAGTVELGAAVKKREGSLFFPGVEEGAAFFHLLQFPNQTHPRQPQEERPEGETRALGCCRRRRARDAGGVRAARRKARAPRYAEQERGTKERGGERVGRGRAPSRLPEDPGRRTPKCHLNPTRGAGAWDPSAWISNNGWSASYKLRESRRGRRTIACPLRPRSWPLETPASPRAGRGAPE